jgi:hypothetical protein
VSVLSEKNVVPPGASESRTRTPPPPPPPPPHRASRASSSSSSSWPLDEKAVALPPYRYHDDSTIDVSKSGDPSWRAINPITPTPNNETSFSSVPMRPASSCPSSLSHSRSSSTTVTPPAHHPHSLIEHQRHYGHRVKPPCCMRITIPPAVKPWLPVSVFSFLIPLRNVCQCLFLALMIIRNLFIDRPIGICPYLP